MPDKPEPSLAGRLLSAASVGGLIFLAILALLSGTDRQSRDFPSSPSIMGWPYDTGAARAKAMLAFVRTGPASAVDPALRSIMSDPLAVQSVSLLGRAQLFGGQLESANKTFEVASQLGWRDAMTQIYWLDQAVQLSDFKVAAERLDALLRQAPDDENRDRLLAVLSASPEGRIALANRLRLLPGWAPRFLIEATGIPREQTLQRVDIVRRIGPGGWDCSTTQYFTQHLITAGLLEEAQSIWRLNCNASKTLVYDGGFEELDTTKPNGGFNWQLSNRGDADISLTRNDSGNQSLSMQVSAAVSVPVIRQLMVLKPGRYRLAWRAPRTDARQANALRVSLACGQDFSRAVPGLPDATRQGLLVQDFVVDAQCPAHVLVFWLAPNAPVRLDDVALEPV